MAAPPLVFVAAAIAALAIFVLVVFAFRRWWRRRGQRQRQRRPLQTAVAAPTPVAVQVKIQAFLSPSCCLEWPRCETWMIFTRIAGPGVSWKNIYTQGSPVDWGLGGSCCRAISGEFLGLSCGAFCLLCVVSSNVADSNSYGVEVHL